MKIGRVEPALSDEHLQIMGKIMASFALLELIVSSCIWSLLSRDMRIGQIVTAQLSFRRLRALFSSLCRAKIEDSDAIRKLERLLDQLAQAEDKRNVVTHSVWATGGAPEMIIRSKVTAKESKGLKWHVDEMTTEELAEIANFIGDVASQVSGFKIDLEARDSRE